MANPFLLIAAVLSGSSAADLTPAEIFRAAAPSIVVVETYDEAGNSVGQGSGVTISSQLVVTNCHVFKDAVSAQVVYQTRSSAASLRHSDPDRDLCTLHVPGLTAPAAKLGNTASLQVGERSYAIGAPKGFTLTLTDGLISSLRPIPGGNVIQTSASISPGSSGGGLFDSQAKLIGITTLYFKDSPQLNFAVPVEWIHELPGRSARGANATSPPRDEIADARSALDDLEVTLRAVDPVGYETRRPELVKFVVQIVETLPPAQWVDAARRAYLSIVEEEATQRAAEDAAAAADAVALQLDPSEERVSDHFSMPSIRVGRRNGGNHALVATDVFLPHDKIDVEVETVSEQPLEIRATWTFGPNDELVYRESKTVSPGSFTVGFQLSKPDGWPVGGYKVTISTDGNADLSKSFCVEDARSVCMKVVGNMYTYVDRNGSRRYSSKPPPKDVRSFRQIRYSYFETTAR